MFAVRRARLVMLAATVLLAACAPGIQPVPGKQAQRETPAGFPKHFYEQAAARGEAVYRVDPERSLVVIEVRRGGALARLGHDHVVAARSIAGYVAPDAGRADLHAALEELTVDEPGLRNAAGFDTRPSESDIAGTRSNMLDRVLEAQRFPHLLIRVDGAGGKLAVSMTLHGVTRTLEVPARVEKDDRQIKASGRLAFAQSDFGIIPFSILGGALRVEDRLELQFTISANR